MAGMGSACSIAGPSCIAVAYAQAVFRRPCSFIGCSDTLVSAPSSRSSTRAAFANAQAVLVTPCSLKSSTRCSATTANTRNSLASDRAAFANAHPTFASS
eukprot:gnl/TRDRNA2_/TRDRNA2_118237_c0_seq2.p2 gnl/TRDRNA2_/TRDRNA2_118237_c0~~gnl/TRDRNA2_/TRDRNA2_118237_c0_seq2.p2  ORF type:complete len:100 (-),score=0.55 gnl/TRDRNA2_/TRDRNA2_118237_c0_seq2:117-416(-)